MQTLIFDFKTKTTGVVGGSPMIRQAYKDILAAQLKIVANSPSTATQPQATS